MRKRRIFIILSVCENVGETSVTKPIYFNDPITRKVWHRREQHADFRVALAVQLFVLTLVASQEVLGHVRR